MEGEHATLRIHGRLADVMASLDPRAQKLLTLFLAGLSLPEMASQMGESEDAVAAAILELVWETRERLAD
jgi:hypothetical protein